MRTDQEAEINKRQRFKGSTHIGGCIKLDDSEEQKQVKDLVAYFPLEVCKNVVFKLPERRIQT